MYLTPRDMAAFGQLYLQHGYLRGQQLIPTKWVSQSIEAVFHQVRKNTSYGYSWWITQISGHNVYYAEGYGNQIIMNVPDEEMVIVFTADTPLFYDYRKREHQIHHLLTHTIFPIMALSENWDTPSARMSSNSREHISQRMHARGERA